MTLRWVLFNGEPALLQQWLPAEDYHLVVKFTHFLVDLHPPPPKSSNNKQTKTAQTQLAYVNLRLYITNNLRNLENITC